MDGLNFASKGGADCYVYLKLLERGLTISGLTCQVQTDLSAGVMYKADFRYYDMKLKRDIWAEFKGVETDRWSIIKKLWKCYGPGLLRIYKGTGLGIVVDEEIEPDKHKQ